MDGISIVLLLLMLTSGVSVFCEVERSLLFFVFFLFRTQPPATHTKSKTETTQLNLSLNLISVALQFSVFALFCFEPREPLFSPSTPPTTYVSHVFPIP
uniref:Secreted protein n=1 Tax=Anopheles darlingi TaxID=43151 RepID=A0A2M4D7W3_ANODA